MINIVDIVQRCFLLVKHGTKESYRKQGVITQTIWSTTTLPSARRLVSGRGRGSGEGGGLQRQQLTEHRRWQLWRGGGTCRSRRRLASKRNSQRLDAKIHTTRTVLRLASERIVASNLGVCEPFYLSLPLTLD